MKKVNILSVALLASIVLNACGTTSESIDTTNKEETTTSSSSSSEKTSSENTSSSTKSSYKVGETITFEGEASYVITGVEWTDERNEFDDTNPERVMKVIYNVNNLSEETLSVGFDLELYANGTKMDSYPNTNTADSISAGRNIEGAVQHFGVNGSGPFELEVAPFASFDARPAIVTLDIE